MGVEIYGNSRQAFQSQAPVGGIGESASVIRDAIGAAEEQASQIHQIIERLEGRLDTILTPAAPTAAASLNAKSPEPVHSHVLARVGALNATLAGAAGRLARIIERVEI